MRRKVHLGGTDVRKWYNSLRDFVYHAQSDRKGNMGKYGEKTGRTERSKMKHERECLGIGCRDGNSTLVLRAFTGRSVQKSDLNMLPEWNLELWRDDG